MKNQKISDKLKISQKENEELENLYKELNDLIDANESLNVGIKKIFKEINKKENNNLNK